MVMLAYLEPNDRIVIAAWSLSELSKRDKARRYDYVSETMGNARQAVEHDKARGIIAGLDEMLDAVLANAIRKKSVAVKEGVYTPAGSHVKTERGRL